MGADAFEPVSLEGRSLACVRGGRRVFAGLDFLLGSGDSLVLRGPNGSGKSSLLRLLAGLLEPEAGEIRVADTPVSDDISGYRSLIHYVGHLPAVKSALTVRENLSFWTRMHDAGSEIDAALRHYGLVELADLPAKYLSEGQQRRCALARTMAVGLPIWLLDEPTTGLDDASIVALGDAMQTHLKAGGVLLAAAHGPLPLENSKALEFAAFQGRAS